MSGRVRIVVLPALTAWVLLAAPAGALVLDPDVPYPLSAGTQNTAETTDSAETTTADPTSTSVTIDLSAYSNGELGDDVLCALSFAPEQRLQCDAAAALEQLNVAYRAEFGTDLTLTDSYRSFEAQVTAHEQKPDLTAEPGYSNHGWGLAIDVAGGGAEFGTTEHEWLVEHAPEYGWGHPTWAAETGSKPEAWHFEFGTGAEMEGPASSYDVTLTLGTQGPPPGWVDPSADDEEPDADTGAATHTKESTKTKSTKTKSTKTKSTKNKSTKNKSTKSSKKSSKKKSGAALSSLTADD
ncbi:D-alanyl-D-alanine carboxypeptidase family protein [Nocardioides sp.]|uniref:M15 family metallopeptidase n=1 Tax=Nocardioides sp. TaxID=35761 RepID=UPI0039E48381